MPLNELSHIHGIAFDHADLAALLLATHAGLFRATREGDAVQVSDDSHDYMGFAVLENGTLVSSGHPAGGGNLGVRASSDGGKSWITLSPGADGPVDFHAIAAAPSDTDAIVGLYGGGVQISTNGGWMWQWSGQVPDQTLDLAMVGAESESQAILAAGMSGLSISVDNGETWELVSPGVATMVERDWSGGAYAFIVGEGLLHSPIATSWEALWNPGEGAALLHLAVSKVRAGELAAITYAGEVIFSSDGGRSWERFSK